MNMKLVWKALEKIKDKKIRAFIINALQEQAEREKGCEYCMESCAVEHLGLTHSGDIPTLSLHSLNGTAPEDEKPKYCPNCGKRL